MKDLEFKGCPFCGGMAEVKANMINRTFEFVCHDCSAVYAVSFEAVGLNNTSFMLEDVFEGIEKLAEIWNRRAEESFHHTYGI